jgi:hypothetical protein
VPRSLPSFAPPVQHSPLCPRHLFSLSLPVWPLVANAMIHRRTVRPRWLRRLAHGLEPGSTSTVSGRRCTRSHLVSRRTRHTDALIPSLILYPSSYFPSPPRNPDLSLFAPASYPAARVSTYTAGALPPSSLPFGRPLRCPHRAPAHHRSPLPPFPSLPFFLSYLISLLLHHRSTWTSPIYLDTLTSKIRYLVTQSVPEFVQFNSYIPSLLPSATLHRLEIDSILVRFPPTQIQIQILMNRAAPSLRARATGSSPTASLLNVLSTRRLSCERSQHENDMMQGSPRHGRARPLI